MRSAACFLLAVLLLLLPLAQAGEDPLRAEATSRVDFPIRPSIDIEGDQAFAVPNNGVRQGSGTAADPYVISDWLILRTSSFGIRLANTSAHVVIENIVMDGAEAEAFPGQNCFEDPHRHIDATGVSVSNDTISISIGGPCDPPIGIDLFHASNVTARQVRIPRGFAGFRILNSSAIYIDQVLLGAECGPDCLTPTYGVLVRWSASVTVRNIDVRGVEFPVFVADSRAVAIERSSLRGAGITVARMENLSFDHNILDGLGIIFTGTIKGLLVRENELRDGPWGLNSGAGGALEAVDVCGNLFQEADAGGSGAIFLLNAKGLTIRGNDIVDSYLGIEVAGSPGAVIEKNRIRGSRTYGMILQSVGAEVHGNAFSANAQGIAITERANATGNWWGNPSGPSGVGPGTGDPLVTMVAPVEFEPWLTEEPDALLDCVAGDSHGATPWQAEVDRGARLSLGTEVESSIGSSHIAYSTHHEFTVTGPPQPWPL